MIKSLYSVKDNKVTAFGNPLVARNDQEAVRELHRAANDTNIQIGLYPSDFDMYFVGTMDDNTGKIFQTPDEPRFVCSAISLKKQTGEEKNGKI